MSTYRPGDIVDITIKGARISTRHSSADLRRIWVEIDGADHYLPSHDSVTVERVAPAEWPPKPGDVWRDRDGTPWFAYETGSRKEMRIVPAGEQIHSGAWWPSRLLADRGPLALAYREPEAGA